MKYLFGIRNVLITSEEAYSLCNLKPIKEKICYSDDEKSPDLEDNYSPKWRTLHLHSKYFSHLYKYSHDNKLIMRRTVDFELDNKAYVFTLDEFRDCLISAVEKLPQLETEEIERINTEIARLKASKPYYFSFLYSLTYYNTNLKTSISNAEYRKNYLLAAIKVRCEKEIAEIENLIFELRKQAKKYKSEHIIISYR